MLVHSLLNRRENCIGSVLLVEHGPHALDVLRELRGQQLSSQVLAQLAFDFFVALIQREALNLFIKLLLTKVIVLVDEFFKLLVNVLAELGVDFYSVLSAI